MKIAVGADHGGFYLKKGIIAFLTENGHEVQDFGTHSSQSCDYPAIGYKVASEVALGKFERGILICKSGLGMCIVANKVNGIRAALLSDVASARSSRKHNDANIAVLSGTKISKKQASDILKAWLEAGFEGGRHAERVDQIGEIEKKIKRNE